MKILSDSLQGELLKSFSKDNIADSAARDVMSKMPDFYDLISNSSAENIVLEYDKNILWRYKTINDTIIGDYESFNLSEDKISYQSKRNKYLIYKTKKIPGTTEKITVKKDLTDNKIIYGYPCYKMIVEIEKNEEEDNPFGNDILEMYVTDHIKLPFYSVLPLNIPNLPFPLEINRGDSNFKEIKTNYKVIKLK